MLPQNGQDILELNLDYVKSIAADVQSRGFKLGTSGVFNADANGYQAYFPDKMLLVLPALAVAAAGVMYLALLLGLSSKLQYILFAVFGAAAAALVVKMASPLPRQLLAFVSACIFPVLSMIVVVEWWESVKVRCKCMVQFFNAHYRTAWRGSCHVLVRCGNDFRTFGRYPFLFGN